MSSDFAVRTETEADHPQIRGVHLAAFGSDQVPNLVDALRSASAPIAPMSYVAVTDNRITGHVMLSAARLDAPRRLVNVLVLSPLGVLPGFQRRGIGTALVTHAVKAAERQGQALVFLEGSPQFYGSRGFERASGAGFRTPSLRIPDPAFQVVRLSAYEPWMTGTLVYSDPFWAHDCVGLREATPADEDPTSGA
jgi:putative acetyltransferase